MVTKPLARALPVLLGAALLVLVGCRRKSPQESASQQAAERPHVLIVMLDSCRADKLGVYGFERPTTPRIDALAADPDAVVFRWHFTQAPHTKASTASLFTGTYPFQHGVIADDLISELKLNKKRYRGRVVAASYETLAERFSAGGYRTFADPSIGHLSADQGFAQGVERFLAPDRKTFDPEHLERTLDYLAESPAPAFAYLHLRACHGPFGPAGRDADYLAQFASELDEARLIAKGIDVGENKLKLAIRAGKIRLTSEEERYVHTIYESVLRRVDALLVGGLVDGLRRRQLYDRTLLVLSADHGDELYDHGGYAHGHAVWNEIVHVPLVVKFPRGARPERLPARVERVSQTIDLYPGLLRQAGIAVPPHPPARDLFDPDLRAGISYSQAPGSWAVVEFPWKIVVQEAERRALLFDLEADVGEEHDLAPSHPEEVRRLVRLGEGLQKMLPRKSAAESEAEVEMSAETIEQLRSLGYIQ